MLETASAPARTQIADELRRGERCAPTEQYPWCGRSAADWQRLVSAAEAADLIALAAAQEPSTGSSAAPHAPAYLARWGLETLLTAYPLDSLRQGAARKDDASGMPTVIYRGEDVPTLTQRCTEVLGLSETAHSAVLPLLLTMRQLRTQRMHTTPGDGDESGGVPRQAAARQPASSLPPLEPLPVDAARALSLTRRQQEDALARYHALIALFAPQVRFQVYRLPEQLVGSRADEEQAVLLRLTDAVIKFYWETAALDPTWTVNRFIRFARTSTHSPATEVFDTSAMQVSVHALAAAQSDVGGRERDAEGLYSLGQAVTDATAQTAVEHIASQEWQHALHVAVEELAVRFPRQAQLFLAHLHGHSRVHLSAETGLSLKAVSNQLKVFRRHLRCVLAARYPDTFPAQLLLRRDHHNTSHLWASLATKTYTPYQLLSLPDKHRQVLERALQVARGGAHERNVILDAVCADFPDIQRQTVRRMIPTAINLLEHRHETGHENTAWADKRRLRAQMAQHYRRIHETNPAAWDALPERHRELIERYCFPDTQPTQLELARQLGCDSSSVSRRLDQLTRSFLRTAGTLTRGGSLLPLREASG